MEKSVVVLALLFAALLVAGCCNLANVQETLENAQTMVTQKFMNCTQGDSITIKKTDSSGIIRVSYSQAFYFSGWENDVCTMRGMTNTCSYTRQEIEDGGWQGLMLLLRERCFG